MDVPKERLWRQYEIHIDLYKHHTELLLKFMAYYYAVTGAILSFYFSQPENRFAGFSLFLPWFISIIYGFIFLYAGRAVDAQIEAVREFKMVLGIHSYSEVELLKTTLTAFGCLLLLTAIALTALLVFALTAFKAPLPRVPSP